MSRTRIVIWSVIAFFVFLGGLWAFWPRAVLVDMTPISVGHMEVAITEEGEARVRDLFVVSSPAAGYLNRIEIDPGECVSAGETRLADIQSPAAAAHDVRTRAQLRAAAQSARAALQLADADVRMREAELESVLADRDRMQRLARTGTVSEQALERAEVSARSHLAAVAAARSAREVARFEIARADAALIPSGAPAREAIVGITSPVTGMVLRVLRDSEGPVAAGEPIIEIGQSSQIEIVVDVLSEDAVRVSEGTRVRIRGWGGPPQMGYVARVEPYAFTKISALGIEEQRTNVIVRFDKTMPGLGHGFRVRADIVLWDDEQVLRLPMSTVFKSAEGWTVYRVENGRAKQRVVQLGRMNGQLAEVIAGVSEDDTLILHPSSSLFDGVRVKARDYSSTAQERAIVTDTTFDVKIARKDPCDAAASAFEEQMTLDPAQLAGREQVSQGTERQRP
ncbi:MAG: efflux RND transporter periplasmic adaptor subunit [Hyphomonadaceae bacterium]|nr:efflux RND transporter periplasmic adaptor subunit [Hyphomonadaceae bacterium]